VDVDQRDAAGDLRGETSTRVEGAFAPPAAKARKAARAERDASRKTTS